MESLQPFDRPNPISGREWPESHGSGGSAVGHGGGLSGVPPRAEKSPAPPAAHASGPITDRASQGGKAEPVRDDSEDENEDLIVLLEDILPLVPTRCLKAGLHDPELEIRFHVDELCDSIARGRVSVLVSRLAQVCPAVFEAPSSPVEDAAIRLPLQKLIEQLGFVEYGKQAKPAESGAKSALPPAAKPAPAIPVIWQRAEPAAAEEQPAPRLPRPAAAFPEVIWKSDAVEPVETVSRVAALVAPATLDFGVAGNGSSVPGEMTQQSSLGPWVAPISGEVLHGTEILNGVNGSKDASLPAEPKVAFGEACAIAEAPLPEAQVELPSLERLPPAAGDHAEGVPIDASVMAVPEPADGAIHLLPEAVPEVAADVVASVTVAAEEPVEKAGLSSTPLLLLAASPPPPAVTDAAPAEAEASFEARPVAEAEPVTKASAESPMPHAAVAEVIEPIPPLPFAAAPPPLPIVSEHAAFESEASPAVAAKPEVPSLVPLEPMHLPVIRPPTPRPLVFVRGDGKVQPSEPTAEAVKLGPAAGPAATGVILAKASGHDARPVPAPSGAPVPFGRPILQPPPLFGKAAIESAPPPKAATALAVAPEAAYEPAIPPLALPRFNQTAIQGVFLTDETLDLPKIAALVAGLPGVEGCLLLAAEECGESGKWPQSLDAARVRAICRQLSERIGTLIEQVTPLRACTLYGDPVSLTFFARDHLCFAVAHAARGFLPGVREKLAAVADGLAQEALMPASDSSNELGQSAPAAYLPAGP